MTDATATDLMVRCCSSIPISFPISIGETWFEGLDRTQVEAVLEFVARSLDRAPEYIS